MGTQGMGAVPACTDRALLCCLPTQDATRPAHQPTRAPTRPTPSPSPAQVLPLIAAFMPLDAAASVMDGVLLGSQEAGWLGERRLSAQGAAGSGAGDDTLRGLAGRARSPGMGATLFCSPPLTAGMLAVAPASAPQASA